MMDEKYALGVEGDLTGMPRGDGGQMYDATQGAYDAGVEHHNNGIPYSTESCVLFVGNLPFHTPWQSVKDHFRKAGRVRYTDLIADRTGRPRGSAIVTMATPEGAERAIQLLNETDFEGRHLIVRRFDDGPRPPLVQRNKMPPHDRAMGFRPGMYGNGIFRPNPTFPAQGNYYRGVANPMMAGRAMGIPNPAMMATSPYRNTPYAVNDMGAQPMVDDGDVDLPKPRSQQVSENGRRLFVSNLPFDCTSAALRETFQQVGTVERAEIIVGRNGKSRGIGVVVMKTEDEARVAIAEFDGIEMANRAMSVRLDNKMS